MWIQFDIETVLEPHGKSNGLDQLARYSMTFLQVNRDSSGFHRIGISVYIEFTFSFGFIVNGMQM